MGRNLNITVIIKSNSLFLLFAGISLHFLLETSSLKTLKDTKVDFQWKCKHLGKSFFEQIELSDSMDWIICLLRSRYEGWGLTQWHNDTGVRCEVWGVRCDNIQQINTFVVRRRRRGRRWLKVGGFSMKKCEQPHININYSLVSQYLSQPNTSRFNLVW